MEEQKADGVNSEISVRRLDEEDLDEADRIIRLAFGTFLGVPDPAHFFGDRQMMRNRWKDAKSVAVFGAYSKESSELVGSNVVTRWGSFGWFGPLTVRPDKWDRGIAKKLMTPTMELFSEWGTTHEGLFTFAQSPKHIGLYEKFGFYPRFLTAIMTRGVSAEDTGMRVESPHLFSLLSTDKERQQSVKACLEITEDIYPGLDITNEVLATHSLGLGDTVFLMDESEILGFAVCHVGANTEAGTGNCYVKFGCVNGRVRPASSFRQLVNSIILFAKEKKATSIEAGVNLARSQAYKEMVALGFRTDFQGVAMHRPNEPGFNRADVFAIDDWR